MNDDGLHFRVRYIPLRRRKAHTDQYYGPAKKPRGDSAAGAFVYSQCRNEISCRVVSHSTRRFPPVVSRIFLGCFFARNGTAVPYRTVRIDLSVRVRRTSPGRPTGNTSGCGSCELHCFFGSPTSLCRFTRVLKVFRKDERGQDIADYAVVLAVILLLVTTTVRLVGANEVFSSWPAV